MEKKSISVAALRKEIIIEILRAFNLPVSAFWHKLIGALTFKPTTRFSEIFAQFDYDITEYGLMEAARRLVSEFTEPPTAVGVENIPKEGPLLITSNHPGTVDGPSILASMPRNDTKVIVGGMPFLQKLSDAREYMIVAQRTENSAVRGVVVRESIRHLNGGGALLIFPSGHIDPDPAVLPGAMEALKDWSRSIVLMLRHAPETSLIPTITSGVLDRRSSHTWLTRFRSDQVGKRRIMEFNQVIRQLFSGERLPLRPLVIFDKPLTLEEIGAGNLRDADHLMELILGRARSLLSRYRSFIQEHYREYTGQSA